MKKILYILIFMILLNFLPVKVVFADSLPSREELTRYAILKSQLPIGAGLPSVLSMLKRMSETNKMADDAWNNSNEGKKINEALKSLVDTDGICHFVEDGQNWLKGINDGLISWLRGSEKIGDLKNPCHGRNFDYEQKIIKEWTSGGGKFSIYYLTDWQYVVYDTYSVQISNGVYRTSKIEYFFNSATGNFDFKEDTFRITHLVNCQYDCVDYGAPSKYSVNDNKTSVLVYTNGDYYNNDIKVENIYNTTTNFEGNTYYTISDDVKTFEDIDKKSPQEVLKKSVDKPVPVKPSPSDPKSSNFIWDGLKGIFSWLFAIDGEECKKHCDFGKVVEKKFTLIYTLFHTFISLSDIVSNESAEIKDRGKFYVDLPSFLGGTRVCILDLTSQAELYSWFRGIIKFLLWASFGVYIIKQIDIKFTID